MLVLHGLGLRGEVLIQRGKFDEGIGLLEQSLDRLRADFDKDQAFWNSTLGIK